MIFTFVSVIHALFTDSGTMIISFMTVIIIFMEKITGNLNKVWFVCSTCTKQFDVVAVP
jgi:hypothetical protein